MYHDYFQYNYVVKQAVKDAERRAAQAQPMHYDGVARRLPFRRWLRIVIHRLAASGARSRNRGQSSYADHSFS